MPLELPEHVRRAFSDRLMLQVPIAPSERERARVRRDMDAAVMGLPGDVFMALDALRLLADQGNEVAKILFDSECEKLGLTRPKFFGPR